jgi:Holliday junction resolvase RusA-like endonuclease
MAYTPKKTRKYEQEVTSLAKAVLGLRAPCNSAVQMHLVCFVPVPASWPVEKKTRALSGLIYPTGKPDLDNYEKAVTDGCNGVVFCDDSQICDVIKSKRYGASPRVHVRFFALGGFEHASHNLTAKKKGRA